MLTVMDLLRLYEKSLEEGMPVPVEVNGEPVRVGQVRELATIPGERFLVLEEVKEGLYLTVPMTSYLQLVNFQPYPPTFVFKGYSSRYALTLACVPVWDYLTGELIEEYSQKIGYLNEESLKRVKEWLNEVINIDLPWYTRKFLSLNSKVWAKLTQSSLLDLEEEKIEVIPLYIHLPEEIPSIEVDVPIYYYGKAPANVMVEKGKTSILFEIEKVGSTVKITAGDYTIYEGKLETPWLVLDKAIDPQLIKIELPPS